MDRPGRAAPQGAAQATEKLMDFYRTLVRMVEVCDGLKTDACELDDDALSGQLLENTLKLIADQPELVLHAAEAVGWIVIPPAENELRETPPAAPQNRKTMTRATGTDQLLKAGIFT